MCKQLFFLNAENLQGDYPSKPICNDYNGNPISVGDYVVACRGKPMKKGYEGYVVKITECEYSTYIKLSTPGGKIISDLENPHDYIVKTNN